jgi:hypothetical protein
MTEKDPERSDARRRVAAGLVKGVYKPGEVIMPTFSVQADQGTRGVTVTDDISGIQQPEVWVENGSAHEFQVVGGDDGHGLAPRHLHTLIFGGVSV